MKTYKKKLKLKENVKGWIIFTACFILTIAFCVWYPEKVENMNNYDYETRSVQVNFTR